MSDIISGVNVRLNKYEVVAEDGSYYGASIDTADPISRLMVALLILSHSNGEYVLSWQDSDDDITFAPVDSSKVIGSASANSATGSSIYPSLGVFGTRRYIRPALDATGIPPATETVSLSGITHVGTTATATFSAPQGLEDGDEVIISGANEPEYNGTFTATNLVGDSFDYEMASDPGANATGTLLAEIPVHPTPQGASYSFFTLQQTEDLGDLRSDVKLKTLAVTSFGADEEYISASYFVGEWTGCIGLSMFAGGLTDGTYSLKIDESDDDGISDPWTEVSPDKLLVGDISIDYDCLSGADLPSGGVFGTKSYIRFRIISTGVTTGVSLIVLFGILESDILPTESV